ncbi:MAG: 30S ribosomal protein S17 [Candidatus Hadarchaeales archaeon]
MEEAKCGDAKCPIHGGLSTRGKVIEGTVVSDKMSKTVTIEVERMKYIPKYERYERRTSRIKAHNPPCISAKTGDRVAVMECRKLSRTKSFAVIKKLG